MLLALLLLAPQDTAPWRFRAETWWAEGGGRGKADTELDDSGPEFDLARDAGLDSPAPFSRLEGGVTFDSGWGLRGVAGRGEWSGAGTLSLALYAIDGTFGHEDELTFLRGSAGLGLLRARTTLGPDRDEWGAGFATYTAELGLRPTPGLELAVDGRFVGFLSTVQYGEAAARASLALGPAAFEAGWRWAFAEDWGGSYDDASLRLDGPFVALTVRF